LGKNDITFTPASQDLFGQKLDQGKAEAFHTTTAQGLFLKKRA